jgi:hypothetical protein
MGSARVFRGLARAVLASLLLGLPWAGAANAQQGDGARAYQLLPDGARSAAVWALSAQGNSTIDPGRVFRGTNVDVTMSILQFTQTINVAGQQAGLFAVFPLGELSVDFNLRGGTRTATSTGTGDLVLGGVFGLVGSPALSLPDYLAYDPGASLGVLAKVGLPTGTYDPDQLVNLGGNRVWGQFGLPMGYVLGTSYLDPELTTFELLPSVIVYGDNNDPFGPATSTGQDPLWLVEAHITRNLSRAFWVSLDAVYMYGGETSTNGVANNDTQRSLGMGATAFLHLPDNAGLKLTYGETVSANADGADGSLLRAIWVKIF